jgi:hypothetical protein
MRDLFQKHRYRGGEQTLLSGLLKGFADAVGFHSSTLSASGKLEGPRSEMLSSFERIIQFLSGSKVNGKTIIQALPKEHPLKRT